MDGRRLILVRKSGVSHKGGSHSLNEPNKPKDLFLSFDLSTLF
jgi:hypothetical protein